MAESRIVVAVVMFCMISGCAHREHRKIPQTPGTHIQFRGVHADGSCEVKDVQLNAQSGVYVVICK